MPSSQSFVDLRSSSLNQGSYTDDSVWPSFTDIMTVVVMIFLMSLVVILLRNVELVKSEQEAARLAELTGSKNIQLENKLAKIEQRIAQIQLQLQAQILQTRQGNENLEQSEQKVSSLMANIQALQALKNQLQKQNIQFAVDKLALEGRLKIVETNNTELEKLKQNVEQSKLVLEDEKQQLLIQLKTLIDDKTVIEAKLSQQQSEFDALKAVYSLLEKDNRTLSQRIDQAQDVVDSLEEDVVNLEQSLIMAEQTIEIKTQSLAVAEAEITAKTETLSETQQQFTELERKYLELVGPARSELNKYVVKIYYLKSGNNKVIDFQGPDDPQRIEISERELHRRLAHLKEQQGQDLYTKVIIPSDSGLTYDQAWLFTREILSQYDYYYQ